jgi:hypothetical protein
MVTLIADKYIYNSTENVTISIKVQNIGHSNVTLAFGSSKWTDFEILNENNERVYLWSYGKAFADMYTESTISPNETWYLSNKTWDLKDQEGNQTPSDSYKIISWICSYSRFYSNYIEIELKNNVTSFKSNISVHAITDKYIYEPKEDINISIKVKNNGNEKIILQFANACTQDFEILNEYRRQIYVWSDDKFFAQVVTKVTILPYESIWLLNTTWSDYYYEGEYLIRAWLPTQQKVYSDSVKFEIKSNLKAILSMDNSIYDLGENVKIKMKVKNMGNEDKTFIFGTPNIAYLEITNLKGERIFYKGDEIVIQITKKITVPANESRTFLNYTWNQVNDTGKTVGPGMYNIIAWTHYNGMIIISNQLTFKIINTTQELDSLELVISTDKKNYDFDDNISVTMKVINKGNYSVTSQFKYGMISDFKIVNSYNRLIYLYSENDTYRKEITNFTFPKGETVILNANIQVNKFTDGNLTIRGWLNSEPTIFSNNVTFIINYNLPVILTTDKSVYNANENISISLTITNNHNKKIELVFPNSCYTKLEFQNESSPFDPWLDIIENCAEVISYYTLQPKSIDEIMNISRPIYTGESNYRIRGLILSSPRLYSNWVEITIVNETPQEVPNNKTQNDGKTDDIVHNGSNNETDKKDDKDPDDSSESTGNIFTQEPDYLIYSVIGISIIIILIIFSVFLYLKWKKK